MSITQRVSNDAAAAVPSDPARSAVRVVGLVRTRSIVSLIAFAAGRIPAHERMLRVLDLSAPFSCSPAFTGTDDR